MGQQFSHHHQLYQLSSTSIMIFALMLVSLASMVITEAEPYSPFWIERGIHGPIQIIRYDDHYPAYYHKREADADAYGYYGHGHGYHGHRHHGYHGHRHHGYGHHGYHGYPHYGYLYGK